MLHRWHTAFKWRKLRLQIWKKRLAPLLERISSRISPAVSCSLHVSWGPFFGGSVMINRKGNKAKIMIRIPYDRYVTMDERKVMARYSIRTKDLPYFIFYHECYHLLDVCSHINQFGPESLHQYQTALSRAVQDTADYRSLDIEHGADEYAFRQYSLLSEKAG